MWNIWEFDRDGEFELALKDIMVMWAMWLCIQTFSQLFGYRHIPNSFYTFQEMPWLFYLVIVFEYHSTCTMNPYMMIEAFCLAFCTHSYCQQYNYQEHCKTQKKMVDHTQSCEFSQRFALHENILTIKQKPFFIVVELLSLPSQKDGCGSMHGELSFCQMLFLAWSCALELRKQGA